MIINIYSIIIIVKKLAVDRSAKVLSANFLFYLSICINTLSKYAVYVVSTHARVHTHTHVYIKFPISRSQVDVSNHQRVFSMLSYHRDHAR